MRIFDFKQEKEYKKVMNFILSIVLIYVGWILASFTLLPVIIIIRFGIPFTKTLEKKEVLNKPNGVIKNYLISLLILSLVFLVITFIVHSFFPTSLTGFLIGAVAVLLLGLGKTGENEDNVKDYFKTNERYLNNKNIEKLYSQAFSKEH